MAEEAEIDEVERIMLGFLERTGVTSARYPPRRYLWTDAHAVCTLLSLYGRTGNAEFGRLAIMLIEQVHNVLGSHRDDDSRVGWISGLNEEDGQKRPTAGGLRIGKKLNERAPSDAFDERLEWDRDGQYFHYLTKWMHALCRAAEVIGDPAYCRWSGELARVAHAGFAVVPPSGGKKRLHWKMSIDLSRPLVPSSGMHDPLDGYITYHEIAHAAARCGENAGLTRLDAEIADTRAMIEGQRWETSDPLGIGGLLFDVCRVVQLTAAGQIARPGFAEALMRAASGSLVAFANEAQLNYPVEYRLAFRELGLSIGLRGIDRFREILVAHPELFSDEAIKESDDLMRYAGDGEAIENFWRRPGNQQVSSWREHQDINSVMLATSLLPDQYLSAAVAP